MEKNKLLMIIIIVLLILILGVSVGVSVYTFTVFNNRQAEASNQVVSSQDTSILKPDQLTTVDVKGTFKTNLLQGADKKDHVISVDISFAVNKTDKKSSDELLAVLADSEAMIKSNILTAIRNRTAEELSGAEAQEILQDYILAKLQEAFNTNLIVEVYASSLYVY